MKKLRVLRPVAYQFEISSPFGQRVDPITKQVSAHYGVDFACPNGTPVRSMADCSVFRVGWEKSFKDYPTKYDKLGFGLRIWTLAKIGVEQFWVWYAHLDQTFVMQDDQIKAGQVVGLSGNTGRSSGPHLHVQGRKKDTGLYYDFDFSREMTKGEFV